MTQIKVKTIDDTTRVRETGIYAMTNERYHSDCANAPSISSSGLVEIDDSPLEFWDKSYYNPDAQEQTKTPYLNFGIAAHELILEGDLSDNYAIRPEKFKTWRSKDAQTWREFRLAEGKRVLTLDDLDNLEGMAEQIQKHPIASSLFKRGLVEASLFVKHGKVYCKSRPDIITFDGVSIVQDYKSCTSSHPRSCYYDIKKFQYETKLANLAWCMVQILGLNPVDLSYMFVFQQTKRPWGITIYPVEPEVINYRVAQNLGALKVFEQAMTTGEWPDRPVSFDNPYRPSNAELEALRARIELDTGDLPAINPETWNPEK